MKSAAGSKPALPDHRSSETVVFLLQPADQKGKEKAFLESRKAIIPFRIIL